MKKNCSSVQLLTVGSGTAGRHSNVADSIYGYGTTSAGAEKVVRRIERVVELLGRHLPGLRKQASSFAFETPLEN